MRKWTVQENEYVAFVTEYKATMYRILKKALTPMRVLEKPVKIDIPMQ